MDDSTRRSLTILATVAVVLIALFVFSVVFRPSCSCGTRESWRARVLGSEPVEPREVSGCGREQASLTIPGQCALKIAPADVRSRRLVIVAVDPIELERVTDADGRRIVTHPKLEPGKDTELSIGKEGESIGLRCVSGTSCRARIK